MWIEVATVYHKLAGTLLIINLLSNYVTQRTMACSNADTYSHFLARQLFRELLLNMANIASQLLVFFQWNFQKWLSFLFTQMSQIRNGWSFIPVPIYAFLL